MRRTQLLSLSLLMSAAAYAAVPFETTSLDDGGAPAQGTFWYTMQIGAGGLVISDNGTADRISLTTANCTFDAAELWAFVGNETDGYTIYNKAAGPSKQLASPKTMSGQNGGTAYVVLREPGDPNYIYTWDFAPSTNIADSWYILQHGSTANAVNNRNSELAFWTTGKDAGSSVVVKFAQTVMDIDLTTGELRRGGVNGTTGQNWNSAWVSNSSMPQLSFVVPYNNMTAVGTHIGAAVGSAAGAYTFGVMDMENMIVTAFEFDFVNNAHSDVITVTAGGKTMQSSGTAQHFSADGFTIDDPASITLSGPNKVIVLSDFKATLTRNEAKAAGVEVMTSVSGGVPYRIPALAVLTKGEHAGRLIGVSDYRFSGGDIGQGSGKIDLHISVSDDNGETWTKPAIPVDADGNYVALSSGDKSAFDCGFGDACIVADRESERVLMMSCAGYGGFFGSTREKPQSVARWYSEDGGDTWTPAQDITEHIYGAFDEIPNGFGPIQGMFFGSGRIMQSAHIKVGDYYRLYAVMSGRNPNGISNWVMYSDNFGDTWTILGDPAVPPVPTGGDEPKAEELPDGSVVLSARVNGGNGRNFNIYRYTDAAKAEGVWGTKVQTLIRGKATPACNGEILMLPAKNVETNADTYLCLQSVPFGPGRVKVGIFWKVMDDYEDFGTPELLAADWDGEFQVSNLSSAYSTMVPDRDGNIAFFYEEDRYGAAYCSVFRTITIEELTDGAYVATEPDTDLALAHAIAIRSLDSRLALFEGKVPDVDFAMLKAAADAYAENPTMANMDAFNRLEILLGEMTTQIENARTMADGGKYVGELYGPGLETLRTALEAYDAAPGLETFAAVKEAMSNPDAPRLAIVDGEQYRIWHFARTAEGKLAANLSNQLKGAAKSRADKSYTVFTFHAGTEPGTWTIECEGKFAGAAPAVENVFTFVDEASAELYTVTSSTTGASAICSTHPTNASYPAWHLAGDGSRIVPWTRTADASMWYIAPENPDNCYTSVDNITVTPETGRVDYYDIYGRRINPAALKPGILYIGTDGSKNISR